MMSEDPGFTAPLITEPWAEYVPAADAYTSAVERLLAVPRIADRLQRSSQTAWIMLWHARNGGKDVHASGWSIRYRRGQGDGPALTWEVRHENGRPTKVRDYDAGTVYGLRMALWEGWLAPGDGEEHYRRLHVIRAPEPTLAHLATLEPICACGWGFKLPLDRLTLAIASEQSRATPRDREGRMFVNVPIM